MPLKEKENNTLIFKRNIHLERENAHLRNLLRKIKERERIWLSEKRKLEKLIECREK